MGETDEDIARAIRDAQHKLDSAMTRANAAGLIVEIHTSYVTQANGIEVQFSNVEVYRKVKVVT